jgi:hypothetical protein
MPSMTCTCGHVFGTGSFPTPNAYLVVSEQDYDELGEINDVATLDRLLFASTKIYQCQKCNELIVLWKDSKEPEFFRRN